MLRIHGIPEEIAAARCVFEDLDGAVATVTEAVQLGIPMARCELLDPAAIRAVNAHDELSEPEAYTLFLEFHGGPKSVAEQVESVREIAADTVAASSSGPRPPTSATSSGAPATTPTSPWWRPLPGTRAQTTDVCVPVSRLAESITASTADAEELPFPAALVGHVADGNYHWICPSTRASEAEQAALAGFVERMVTRAQEAGGTCTGEHGVGMGKREALLAQSGEAAVETMRALKRALDPAGILNPGKVLPE